MLYVLTRNINKNLLNINSLTYDSESSKFNITMNDNTYKFVLNNDFGMIYITNNLYSNMKELTENRTHIDYKYMYYYYPMLFQNSNIDYVICVIKVKNDVIFYFNNIIIENIIPSDSKLINFSSDDGGIGTFIKEHYNEEEYIKYKKEYQTFQDDFFKYNFLVQ